MSGELFRRYAAIFSELDDAVVVSDAERRIVYVNAAAERTFGYVADEMLGSLAALIYAAESDFSRLGRERFNASRTGGTEKYRVFYRRKSGEIFASETVTSTVHEDGRVVGFLAIIRDITDRLAVEKEAAAAARLLEDAIEAIDEGFALYDAEDRLAVCNRRYRELYPKSAAAMVPGARFRDILLHGLRAGEYDTGGLSIEDWLEERLLWHRRADATRVEQQLSDGRWLQVRERRTRDSGVAGIRADITALKSAQQALAAVRRDRETLTNSMPCLIEELDREARCVFINEVGARWLGMTGADAVGQQTGTLFSAADQAKIAPFREDALAGRPAHLESTLDFPDGARRDVVIDYIPKTGDSGTVVGVFVFIADITEQKRVERTLHRLHSISMMREEDRGRRYDLILEAGCRHYDLPAGVVSRVDGDDYTITHVRSPNGRIAPGTLHTLAETYCAEMLAYGGVLALERAGQARLREREGYATLGFESYIGAPIYVDGALHGALFFAGPEPRARPFTAADREIARQFADWIGHELARDCDLAALHRANAELAKLAKLDELTGILNRREFRRRADVEFERARRYGEVLSVLLVDLDHFKRINDGHGHAAGDEVLRRFAKAVVAELRPSDIFGRLGGEEFGVVLGHANLKQAFAVAERVRNRVRGRYGLDEEREITVSIGTATLRPGDASVTAAMERADRALYIAKAAGRNMTCVFPGDEAGGAAGEAAAPAGGQAPG